MPLQRSRSYPIGLPVCTRMTTVEFFLISPIWPSSTFSVKPDMSEGLKLARPRYPALKRGSQFSIALRALMNGGPDRADGSAAKLDPDKRGNAEQQKDEKKNQKNRVDGKDGGRENAGKRQHREK